MTCLKDGSKEPVGGDGKRRETNCRPFGSATEYHFTATWVTDDN